jgi:hypothetical protein
LENSGGDVFCRKCGAGQEQRSAGHPTESRASTQPIQNRPSVAVAEARATNSHQLAITLAIIGFFAGGLIGYILRPSVFLVGQLPFETVITRGAYLTGLDLLLRSTAQASFNLMATAAIVTALAGGIVGLLIKMQSAPRG